MHNIDWINLRKKFKIKLSLKLTLSIQNPCVSKSFFWVFVKEYSNSTRANFEKEQLEHVATETARRSFRFR